MHDPLAEFCLGVIELTAITVGIDERVAMRIIWWLRAADRVPIPR
jgi:hypothetical protein